MKRVIFIIVAGSIMLSSCISLIKMQKTYPPQYSINDERKDFVFVNYYDYVIPEYIKDKHEGSYGKVVSGFIDGLSEVFNSDSLASLYVADTLARGYTIGYMQTPAFTDTVIALCTKYNANMLIAIDSMIIGFSADVDVEEDEDGSVSKTKHFYLHVRPYVSLYSSSGEVIDNCSVERWMHYLSRPTITGLITIAPPLEKAGDEIAQISFDAGTEFAGKFYPSDGEVQFQFYIGDDFETTIDEMKKGNLGHAVDLLTTLTQSPKKSLARKATHNLSVLNEIIENRGQNWQFINSVK